MKKLNIIIASTFLVLGTFSHAQTHHNLDNDDKKDVVMTKNFKAWDSDNDGKIDMKEFKISFNKTNSYEEWDTNTDKVIDEKEWHKGISLNYENSDLKYIDWDLNGDKLIDQMEYFQGSFEAWDNNSDGFINESEFSHWQNKGMK